MMMERAGPWFGGSGASFVVVVYANGAVEYEGVSDARVLGRATYKVSRAALDQLRLAFQSANFSALAPLYKNGYHHGAGETTVCWNGGGTPKTVLADDDDPRLRRRGETWTLRADIEASLTLDSWTRLPRTPTDPLERRSK
jgi:hypothetical protein